MQLSRNIRTGLLVGLLATTTLLAVLYAFAQARLISFIPLDIAQAITNLTPGQIATSGIETLGPLAKLIVEISGFLLLLLAGAIFGALLVRQQAYSTSSGGLLAALIALIFTLIAQSLAGHFPDLTGLITTTLLLGGWGMLLAFLLRRALAEPVGAEASSSPASPERRVFLRRSSGVLLTVTVGSTALGELMRRTAEQQIARQIAAAPNGIAAVPGAPLPPLSLAATPPGAGVGVVADAAFKPVFDVRPELTPTDKLYVVATTFSQPRVDVNDWRLEVTGMVERPRSFSYNELLAMPRLDQTSTLTCISNEIGADLIGNITWTGVRLRDILQQAGVISGAVDVVLHSVEGYSDSITLERALNPQNLIVYGMNGITLPISHGFPARLIVPGIYGMKNVKWLGQIEVVGEDYKGFWQRRGWSDPAVVKTQSTIDTGNYDIGARQNVRLENGKVVIGGYAFAGDRGISAVEVQIDGGEWQPAQLKQATSALTWRQWRYEWPATLGDHAVVVRARDGLGQIQTQEQAQPHPDGASGWHQLSIEVMA